MPGANAGSRTSTSTVRYDRPGADPLERPLEHGLDPELPDVAHEEARDPALGLPGEDVRLGPVAAQADLDVAGRVDVALLHEAEHRRPVRALDAEDLGAGVGVRVEVQEAQRPAAARDRAQRRLGDRVVAAEDDRDRARVGDLPDVSSIAACVASGSAGITGASPKSTARSARRASTPASRCVPGGQLAARIARGPYRVPGRSETRSSVGAPTIATSTPSSSAGSSVYGRLPKVSRPA